MDLPELVVAVVKDLPEVVANEDELLAPPPP
jgi:hypothetical protein